MCGVRRQEYCDRGNLDRAVSSGHFRRQNGWPDLVRPQNPGPCWQRPPACRHMQGPSKQYLLSQQLLHCSPATHSVREAAPRTWLL